MHRWRHRRITFSEELTPEIADGFVYTDNAQPPNTTVIVAEYREGAARDVDRLLRCSITDDGDVVTITGTSTWLLDTVHVPLSDAQMTVYVHANPRDCVSCS